MLRFMVIGFLTLFFIHTPAHDLWAKPRHLLKLPALHPKDLSGSILSRNLPKKSAAEQTVK